MSKKLPLIDMLMRLVDCIDMKQLIDIGVLREHKVGREKLFLHPKFLTLLTQDDNEYESYPA